MVPLTPAGRRLFITTLVMIAMTLTIEVPAARSTSSTYVLSVLPQQPAVAMHAAWRPLADRLEQELNIRIKLQLYERMSQFEDDISRGIPDLIFSTPAQYYIAYRSQGYQPLIRGAKPISGVLFVRKESPYKDVRELKGADISFVGNRNICSILVRNKIINTDQLNFKPIFTGSTANVFKNVLIGKSVAGATLDHNLDALPPDIASQLRPLLKTDPIAPHPIAAHPRLPATLREALTTALLKLWNSSEGKQILMGVRIGEPVKANFARDYKQFEKIDIDALSRVE